jgi:peptidoglycan/LPS O-acetylase OafA/YrhL
MSERLPSLDGWRAVSIALVIGHHVEAAKGFPAHWKPAFHWAFDGVLGVQVFFVISGLLITWLLLNEHGRANRVNLKHFYARRALRILPVYVAFLIVLALLDAFTSFDQSRRQWIANLTFTTNFVRDIEWASGHLWSLAVEEQFYFAWPFLFLIVADDPKRALRWLAMPVILAPLCRVAAYMLRVPYSFFSFWDSLALGCACAVLLKFYREETMRWLAARWIPIVALALIITPYTLVRFHKLGWLTVPVGASMVAVGISLLLLQSILMPDRYRFLNLGPVRWIGVLSYSLYIWQQLACAFLPVAWVLPTIVASAILSYYGLERPLFRLRARFGGSPR